MATPRLKLTPEQRTERRVHETVRRAVIHLLSPVPGSTVRSAASEHSMLAVLALDMIETAERGAAKWAPTGAVRHSLDFLRNRYGYGSWQPIGWVQSLVEAGVLERRIPPERDGQPRNQKRIEWERTKEMRLKRLPSEMPTYLLSDPGRPNDPAVSAIAEAVATTFTSRDVAHPMALLLRSSRDPVWWYSRASCNEAMRKGALGIELVRSAGQSQRSAGHGNEPARKVLSRCVTVNEVLHELDAIDERESVRSRADDRFQQLSEAKAAYDAGERGSYGERRNKLKIAAESADAKRVAERAGEATMSGYAVEQEIQRPTNVIESSGLMRDADLGVPKVDDSGSRVSRRRGRRKKHLSEDDL